MNSTFSLPTSVIFGCDVITENAALFSNYGRRALIVTGKNSAKLSGALDLVTAALASQQIAWDIFDEIAVNPTIESVRAGGERAREVEADFVIGIGGGSPLDAAKAIALLALNDLPGEELFGGNYESVLPIIAIPLTSGTGSEVTPYSILTDNSLGNKRNLAHPLLFPAVALLEPALTASLSREQTIYTALDAFSHAFEGLLSNKASLLSDALAYESIALIGQCREALGGSSYDYELREKLAYASMLAGMVIAHTGTTGIHAMGYGLTYHKSIDHGRANALLMTPFLRFLEAGNSAKIGRALGAFGVDSLDALESTIATLLDERLSLTDDEIELFADNAAKAGNIVNSTPHPDRARIVELYREACGR